MTELPFPLCRHLSRASAKSDTASPPPLLSSGEAIICERNSIFPLQLKYVAGMPSVYFRTFRPLCHLLRNLQVFFKMPASWTLLGYFIKMTKTVLCFLWQAPGNYFPVVKLKMFSYRRLLLITQSWAKFTQIHFTFKIHLYIPPFLLRMLKTLGYTDVIFFTSVFKTEWQTSLKKKRAGRERDKVPPVTQELGYKEEQENASCWAVSV